MYAVDELRTASSRDGRAEADWREWCSDVHGRLDFDYGSQAFQGVVSRQFTGTYSVVGWTSRAESAIRSRPLVRTDPRDHVEILFPVRGAVNVRCGDVEQTLGRGDFAIVPGDIPFRVSHDDGVQAITVLVPGTRTHRISSIARPGVGTIASTGLTNVVQDLLVSIHGERGNLTQTQFDTACDRALDLLTLAASGDERVDDPAGTPVLDAVRRHVRDHATDPDLSLASIASAVGWSRRYIQLVLARHDLTVTELIRTERLERAAQMLRDPALRDRTIATIASAVGFSSASAFSAAFRERFGHRPRDVR